MMFPVFRSLWLLLLSGVPALCSVTDSPSRAQVLDTMKRATTFMVEKVSCQGGYVWTYLPDLSRRWGEMEAGRTMIWIQPPGTPAMGQLFLDAYRATGDEYYYQAAKQTADVLIRVQHPSGGWNYTADLAGEASLRKWYDTIGRNGWRLEEFQHYYGNATFDDQTTVAAATFLLWFSRERPDGKYKAALDRAIGFVLASQYPGGGWPQRFPLADGFSKNGNPDYTGYVTFNDDVAGENIRFLTECYRRLGDPRLLEPIQRGMDLFVTARQSPPQAGWAMQYTPDLQPAGARTYEPKALVTHTTARNIGQLLHFYSLTGDRKFLAPIPDALAWLDAVRLPPELVHDRATHPTFLEPGTNRPLYIHRMGSNVVNGRYYADYDPKNTLGHYSSFRSVDVGALRARYEKVLAVPPEEVAKGVLGRSDTGPANQSRLRAVRDHLSDEGAETSRDSSVRLVVATLNSDGYWPTPLPLTSHPYVGDGSMRVTPGDFSRTMVGDEFDTSPYPNPQPVMGISVATYVDNMKTLIRHLAAGQ